MHWWRMSLAIFVQLLGIATAAVNRGLRDTSNEAGNEAVCVTQVCNDTASRIIIDMAITVNPCDDFYKFACGGYLERDLPSGTVKISVRNTAKTEFKLQLKSLLETNYELDELRTVKLAKTLYKTCMNEESIEEKGLQPLKNFIQMLGGWPVVEGASWNESNFDWMATTAAWNRVGMPPVTFMDISIDPDIDNLSQHALYIKPPSWIIKERDLKKGFNGTVAITAYYTMMVDVAVSFGADREKAKVELKEALLFQIQLSNALKVVNPGKARFTLKTLIKDYPRVNWRDIFARMYSAMQTIGDDDPVIVYSSQFINNVIDLVSNESKRVLANFAMFQIIASMLRFTNKETIDKLHAYQLARDNYVESKPRWIFCTDGVISGMPAGAAHMYAKKFFKPEDKIEFEDMVQKIREEFRANIDKIPYLDVTARTAAKEKEREIKVIVGHPNTLFDNDALEKYYKDLYLYDDHLVNMFFLWKFHYAKKVYEFRKPPNYTNSTAHMQQLLTSLGYSTPIFNSIGKGVLFDLERPRYMNFGTSGTTIGHEITHLFDNDRKLSVKNGANNGVGIFATGMSAGFRAQVQCFQDQYGNYTDAIVNRNVDGISTLDEDIRDVFIKSRVKTVPSKIPKNVDGHLTLDENIADNAAVKRAYHAYVKTMSGKPPEKQLFGLNYTPTQMFWIAYANKNCEKKTLSYWNAKWNKNTHAPGRYRVIGPLSNSQEFANDFKCTSGSKMNPVNKCSIW